MRKIFGILSVLMLIAMEAFAFGHTTIIGEKVSGNNKTGYIPVVDGLNALPLQKNINSLLRGAADNLMKEAGGKVTLSYEVTMNRPTMFSVVLKAVGNKTVYKGMNIDDTTGKEVVPKDLFYLNDNYNQALGNKEYVFGEAGLLCATQKSGPFIEKVPYSKMLKSVNIADGARYITSYKLTAEAEGKTLQLKAGELIALYLGANPTTGYNWTVANGDSLPGYVKMGNSFFLPSRNERNIAGAPGTTIVFFSFDRPGSYDLALTYDRSWEHNPLYTKHFYFVVK